MYSTDELVKDCGEIQRLANDILATNVRIVDSLTKLSISLFLTSAGYKEISKSFENIAKLNIK